MPTLPHTTSPDTSPAQGVLELHDLKTHFFLEKGTIKAVDGVNLTLARNSTLGLVGESGSGKSVTARSIMRLIQSPPGKIVSGNILLHRQSPTGESRTTDIATLDDKGPEIRAIRGREISMIFQEPMTSLNPLHTIGRQIREVVMLHQRLNKKAANEVALEMLDKVRLSDPKLRLTQYPHQLSGGMRQRVMIALALSCNPQILIADEPTTALDVTVQAQILELMQELKEVYHSSIILITHNLGVVSQMADRIAVMYFGKVVEKGSAHDIFHHPMHPYTRGLLASVPIFGKKKHDKLFAIRGMVPSASAKIRGCAFAERCQHVMDACRDEPPLQPAHNGHDVACWLHH